MISAIYAQINYILTVCWRRRYLIFIPILILTTFGVYKGMSSLQFTGSSKILINEVDFINPFLNSDPRQQTQSQQQFEQSLTDLLTHRNLIQLIAQQTNLIERSHSNKQNEVVFESLSNNLSLKMLDKRTFTITYKNRDPNNVLNVLNVGSTLFSSNLNDAISNLN